MSVRIATLQDTRELCRLLMLSHQENGLFPFSLDKVQWTLHCLLTGNPSVPGVIGVIGTPEKLEALAMVIIAEYWYTRQKHLEELIVFVDPGCRRSSHARDIITWLSGQVQETGIPLISGIISTDRTEAKCRLYRRMMPKIGEFFLVAPKGAHVEHEPA